MNLVIFNSIIVFAQYNYLAFNLFDVFAGSPLFWHEGPSARRSTLLFKYRREIRYEFVQVKQNPFSAC